MSLRKINGRSERARSAGLFGPTPVYLGISPCRPVRRLGKSETHRRAEIRSGQIPEAPGENWQMVENALCKGLRGLAGGSSLARLLAEKRGSRKGAPHPQGERLKLRRMPVLLRANVLAARERTCLTEGHQRLKELGDELGVRT